MVILLVCVRVGLELPAQGFAHYRGLFWGQMRKTCGPGLRWEKSVAEVEANGVETRETKVFDVDCRRGTATSGAQTIALLSTEFSHLFEFAYDSPYESPYLDIQQGGTGVVARVKAGQEDDSRLRLQRFVTDAAGMILLEAEAWIVKESPLYDLEVHITVWFDGEGRYVRHAIETKTDVWLGGDLHTRILARLVE